MTVIDEKHLRSLCRQAIMNAGSSERSAQVLADATVEAERVGNRAVGLGHLFDYLDGYRQCRISSDTISEVHRPTPALFDVNARGGIAQEAFVGAAEELSQAAREYGLSALWVRNSFTCGELGFYPRRLARDGMVSIAVANSPALMSLGGGSSGRILGTNPHAFGLPRPHGWPMVIDQASSATAFVNIRRAAERGEEIPLGWALGSEGEPTQDASEALVGTLLPFGSHRGGNIALLVELLATLSGATFSIDAPPFDVGARSPNIGVFVLCIDVTKFPGSLERLWDHIQRLRENHQVWIPAFESAEPSIEVDLEDNLLARLQIAAADQ